MYHENSSCNKKTVDFGKCLCGDCEWFGKPECPRVDGDAGVMVLDYKVPQSELKWTFEAPNIPGWYWYCNEGERENVIVEVVDIGGHLRFCDGRLPASIWAWPGKWAGPIPMPSK